MAVIDNRSEFAAGAARCSFYNNNNSIRRGVAVTMYRMFFLVLCFAAGFANANPRGCDPVKTEMQQEAWGLPAKSAVLERPADGPICGSNSCCGSERELVTHNNALLDSYVKNTLDGLSSMLDFRARRFDGFFRDMLAKSKREFHEMFEKTYGIIYIQNSAVFSDFFDELERYYNKGKVRLAETMDTFFGILYQRMFTVINSQYQFSEKYLDCVAEHMAGLKPFGDVPHKFGIQLKRSFVATRTFYKAVAAGAEIVANMATLKTDEECGEEMVRLRQCGICKGHGDVKFCSAACSSIVQHCLRHFITLATHWDNYIDALEKVSDRLSGPFNIEMVVEPINIKISEAIMNFQETGTEVSNKIFSGCGTPSLDSSRQKRAAEAKDNNRKAVDEIAFESLSFPGGKKKHKKTEAVPTTLERLIREIKLKVKDMRQFWTHLPYQFCNNEKSIASPSVEDNCWNGTAIGRFEQSSIRRANGTSSRAPTVLQEQIYTLQMLQEHLHNAYQGQDVDFADDAEEQMYGSGSGSGDGDYGGGGGGDDDDDNREIGSAVHEFDNNNRNNEIEGPPETQPPQTTTTVRSSVVVIQRSDTSGSTTTTATMSLTRALANYVLPIVLVWFGGAISDLL